MMKKMIYFSSVFTMILIVIMSSKPAYTFVNGAPSGNSGSVGDNNVSCAKSGCHSGGPAATSQAVSISTDIPASGYQADSSYTITITADAMGAAVARIGFQAVVEDPNGLRTGSMALTNAAETRLTSGGAYITHTQSGTSLAAGTDEKTWTFQWTAPSSLVGPVNIQAAINFANGNGNAGGDLILTESHLVQASTLGIGEQVINWDFKVYPNPSSEQLNISFDLLSAKKVQASLLDLSGREVTHFIDETVPAGTFNRDFELGSAIKSGTYVLAIQAGATTKHQKILISK